MHLPVHVDIKINQANDFKRFTEKSNTPCDHVTLISTLLCRYFHFITFERVHIPALDSRTFFRVGGGTAALIKLSQYWRILRSIKRWIAANCLSYETLNLTKYMYMYIERRNEKFVENCSVEKGIPSSPGPRVKWSLSVLCSANERHYRDRSIFKSFTLQVNSLKVI